MDTDDPLLLRTLHEIGQDFGIDVDETDPLVWGHYERSLDALRALTAAPARGPEPAQRECDATWEPTDGDSCIGRPYRCNRTEPHRLLHCETAPDGEEIAWWCSCPECQPAAPAPAASLTRNPRRFCAECGVYIADDPATHRHCGGDGCKGCAVCRSPSDAPAEAPAASPVATPDPKESDRE